MMKIAHDGPETSTSDNLVLSDSGHFLRSNSATVNFTAAEAKIVIALVDAGAFGLCISDVLVVLSQKLSDSSIHVGRTHISKIRQKIRLISQGGITLYYDKGRRRYAFVGSNILQLYRTYI
jgi:hypothetical protein